MPLNHRPPRILVVGDLMIDHYLVGTTERISPEAPVPVVDIKSEATALGGAGNVVSNLLALEADVVIASVVGDDPDGSEILALLASKGVATGKILRETSRRTSRKTRLMATHQQVARFDRESRGPISQESEVALVAAMHSLHDPVDAVLLSDYNKGVLTRSLTHAVIALARRQSIPVLVDPKGTDCAKYRGATLVTPNRKEAQQLAGATIDSDESLCAAGKKLQRLLEVPYVVITLSEQGMAIFGESMTKISTAAREVYDVTGAGDTVLATLGFAMATGMNVIEAARLANCAAAVVVAKLGSATATMDEIIQYQSTLGRASAEAVIKSADEIERIAEKLRCEGKRIVFTNGCFDLLHRGHVDYLQASRACGDALIVGVNSDRGVRRLKGTDRPVVGQDDRSHLVAALACVDYVVVFDEDTPYELIRRIRPDVLTKGSDYAADQVVGRELAGEVRLISLVEGRSTSSTIDRIRHAA